MQYTVEQREKIISDVIFQLFHVLIYVMASAILKYKAFSRIKACFIVKEPVRVFHMCLSCYSIVSGGC